MDESPIEAVLRRAGYACEYCLLPQSLHPGPYEVEHVIPKQHGGRTRLSNLACSCLHCNRHKSAGSGTDSLAAIDNLEIGGIEMGRMVVGGHDLSDVNKIVKAYLDPLIDGEVGADVLDKYGALVDFSVPELYLRPRKSGK